MKIEHAEMRLLCPVVGYTLLDQKQSTDICPEQEIFNLTEKIKNERKTGMNIFQE
jgi:hypothetical protein